ncbi:MAG: SemiSWEET family sugar transporter [Candidatus Binatia bacterium]
MDFTTVLGLLAGALTTISFIPQLTKIRRTKSAEDISTSMFVTFCAGVALWLIYGIMNRDLAVIAANFVTLLLALMILILKAKYARE